VSTTLTDPSWQHTTVVPPDPAAIRSLKASVDGNIGMTGCGTTVRWLLAHGLLDELRLMLHPVVVGHGERLFHEGENQPMRLVGQDVFTTGVAYLRYAPT